MKLDYLPASFDAASKQHVPGCLEHTRVQILSEIREWIDHDSDKRIYWLNGMAGTGKSTISLTIAREYHEKKQLGASFFFSRGGGDLASTNKLASTVAIQLAEYSPVLRQHLLYASALNPRISHLALYNQWQKLILEPLGLLKPNDIQSPLLIIIDALDECDDERDIAMLIECFASTAASIKKIPLRLFITSRPDRPVNVGFGNMSTNLHHYFVLHSIEQSIVDGDLMIYYRHQLAQLSQRHSWNKRVLSGDMIESLVHKSHGLFIYAATVCRFVDQGGILAEQRLINLYALGPSHSGAEKELDRIYTTVLESSFGGQLDGRENTILQQRFQKVVGSILVLFDTFNLSDLAGIIDEPKTVAISVLQSLGSVLEVSEDEGKHIDILHPSFRDFLLESGRCSNELFVISPKQLHYNLFERCLAIMRNSLHKDMCSLKKPGAKARDISKSQVDKCIPLSVQYACTYWIKHLQKSGQKLVNHEGMVNFFRVDFLGWLEVLGLLGRLPEGISMLAGLLASLEDTLGGENHQQTLQSLRKLIKLKPMTLFGTGTNRASDNSQILNALLRDAKQFAFRHARIIEEAPLQVYCSALLFSPEQSLIRQIYHNQTPNWMIPSFQRRGTWSAYTQFLWHQNSPGIFNFSPDGNLLASACSDGTIWLWDLVTGANQRILESHSKSASIFSLVFSSKGNLIASGSADGAVRLWNYTSGIFQGILRHKMAVYRVKFSPDGTKLVSYSRCEDRVHHDDDGKARSTKAFIRLWDIASRKKQWKHPTHNPGDISFLPDGKRIVYSCQGVTGLLDAKTGRLARILAKHIGQLCSSGLLSSGQMIGLRIAAYIELYDVQTNVRRWRYKTAEFVSDISFSPDDRVLAAAFRDRIELLNAVSGHRTHAITYSMIGSTKLNRIAFSSDGKLLATSLHNNTIIFWDTTVGRRLSATYPDLYESYATTTSECGNFVAIMLFFKTNRLQPAKVQLHVWDTQNLRTMYAFSLTAHRNMEYMILSPNAQLIAIQWKKDLCDLFDCKLGKSVVCSNKATCGFSSLDDRLRTCIFSPDSKFVALWTVHRTIQIWDTQSFTMAQEIKTTYWWYPNMAFSFDSKLFAVTTTNQQLDVFDLQTGLHLTRIKEVFSHTMHLNFLLQDRIILCNRHMPGLSHKQYAIILKLLDAHSGAVLRVIELLHPPCNSYQVKSFSAVNILLVIMDKKTCRIWDLETGRLENDFEVVANIDDIHLLPCKAHLRINERIVPLSISDSPDCCSHRISFEKPWIKRGDEKLLFIPQDYSSDLMAVRCDSVSFQPFMASARGRFTTSQLINTLRFDLSINEGFI